MAASPGAFRANTPPLDPAAMERDLGRIPAVSSARVVVEDDELREVHVVCGAGRSPKLIGRDVQSLLAAQWGVDVDQRKISIVALEVGDDVESSAGDELPQEPPAAAPSSRGRPVGGAPPFIGGLSLSIAGAEAQAVVTVEWGNRTATGRASGAPSWAAQRRLAAEAALLALAQLDQRLVGFVVSDVIVTQVGSDQVVVATFAGMREGLQAQAASAATVGPAGELRAAADAAIRAFTF